MQVEPLAMVPARPAPPGPVCRASASSAPARRRWARSRLPIPDNTEGRRNSPPHTLHIPGPGAGPAPGQAQAQISIVAALRRHRRFHHPALQNPLPSGNALRLAPWSRWLRQRPAAIASPKQWRCAPAADQHPAIGPMCRANSFRYGLSSSGTTRYSRRRLAARRRPLPMPMPALPWSRPGHRPSVSVARDVPGNWRPLPRWPGRRPGAQGRGSGGQLLAQVGHAGRPRYGLAHQDPPSDRCWARVRSAASMQAGLMSDSATGGRLRLTPRCSGSRGHAFAAPGSIHVADPGSVTARRPTPVPRW